MIKQEQKKQLIADQKYIEGLIFEDENGRNFKYKLQEVEYKLQKDGSYEFEEVPTGEDIRNFVRGSKLN